MTEPAITSIKKVSGQLDYLQRGLGILVAVILLIPIGSCILPTAISEIAGSISVAQAQYPGAELIYSGYRVVGSSDYQSKSFVYWTKDSTEDVKTYYEKKITVTTLELPVYKGSTIKAFRGALDRLIITFANSNQDHVGNLLDSYRDDPYSKIDNLPRTGTIIIMTHDVYTP